MKLNKETSKEHKHLSILSIYILSHQILDQPFNILQF
jgi:hypothetical protein